uniref:Venom peptidase s10-like protein 1 n=1 Tax=Pristhesancus plagipennis TaxID=1955184 RepID=A0A1Q1NPC7_PRIPG|nr:venom peptidase s10-like protein 1 [Pristhesancus plagipennis]
MFSKGFIIILILVNIYDLHAHHGHHHHDDTQHNHERQQQPPSDNGALFLSPYIERGDIENGQRSAAVRSINNDNIESYSGFITTNKQYNSNMFFWFYPAEKDKNNAPLVIWLHGGPGASSVYGLFELGPYYLDKKNKLQKRDNYLSQTFNMLYIDNPVGTGFSFTDNKNGLSKDENDIADNLYETLIQFYKLFPQYKKNELYISGSSYAGKFTTAFGYKIDQNQKNLKDKINFKGLLVGNGFFDPAITIQRAKPLYQNGLIDFHYKKELEDVVGRIIALINEKKFGEALDLNAEMRKTLEEKTGYTLLFDLAYNTDQYPYGDLVQYLSNIRSNIHVGNITFDTDENLVPALRNELMQSVTPWFEYLSDKYPIVLYSGQLDMEIPYISSVNFLLSLRNNVGEKYKTAERQLWSVDNELAGYKKTAGKLIEVLVRNAGHNAHIDQPKFVFKLFRDFIANNTV